MVRTRGKNAATVEKPVIDDLQPISERADKHDEDGEVPVQEESKRVEGETEEAAPKITGDRREEAALVEPMVPAHKLATLEMSVKLFIHVCDKGNTIPLLGDSRRRFEHLRSLIK